MTLKPHDQSDHFIRPLPDISTTCSSDNNAPVINLNLIKVIQLFNCNMPLLSVSYLLFFFSFL